MALTNAQYDRIMRRYDSMHQQAIIDRDKRLEYINTHLDGYKELSDAVAALSLEHTKRALSGDKNALLELKSLISDLTSQKEALLAAAGYPADYLKPAFACPDCCDTGYIENEKCHCFKQQIITLLYDQSGISDQLKDVSFDKMSDKYYRGADFDSFIASKQRAISFVDNFDSDYQNLLIYGTVGVGKSLLSSCIASSLLSTGHSVIYFSAVSLFDELSRAAFSKESKKTDELDNIYNCDLLIIDDLGTEMTTNFTVSSLFSLLNERIIRKKPIVISTNASLESIRERYTDRTFSRITGSFSFCHMTGPDIRIAQGTV